MTAPIDAALAMKGQDLGDLLKPDRRIAIQRGCRYFRGEKCQPQRLPNDFWIVARSGGQIFDGRMATVEAG